MQTTIAIALSVVAALLFAVAAVLQERGTQGLPDSGVGFFKGLVQRKVWLLGIAADIAGFAVQAGALAVGSLLLVQPLLVTTLLFALPLAAWTQKRRLTLREWFWAAVLTASLIVFIVVGEPAAGISSPSGGAWIIPIAIMIPAVAVCVVGSSRMRRGTARSLVLAVAAGLLLGYSAPFTKTAMDAFGQSFLDGLASWEFWMMAVTATLGTLWQQSSYQAGDVQTSLPAVTVLKPIVAMVLGLTIYQETLNVGHVGDGVVLASVVVMCLATVALGRLSVPDDDGTTADSAPGAAVPD
ncbi:DMT family transporter [Gordonia sp. (in: high G+C Gram-positive bacteria)]|uniref:DMT family transporter n=1 Tax=Gordonia sp. (in: high G+C Gram-positive bacteria) TaxID=84139 RepID=UPI0025C25EFF|nr:DMT family transporter [Gordonia sp. (in: high G+C Gram-positive bacteria)]